MVAEIDARRVDRILRNLIYNAIDHADGRPVELELAADDDVLAITVTDHGVGLRPGEAGLVFNRFWRADPSRQRQTGGTGLGLAISLEDARLHGGWLQASGAPGEGARFRLTLPRRHGGLITQSPLPLRHRAPDRTRADRDRASDAAVGATGDAVEGVRMMVEDGTLKAAPSDDELHPAIRPGGGPDARRLSSTGTGAGSPGGGEPPSTGARPSTVGQDRRMTGRSQARGGCCGPRARCRA